MGKQSRRNRQGGGRPSTKPFVLPGKDGEAAGQQQIVKCGPPVDLPPAQPGWESYTEAIVSLKAWGFRECVFVVDFSPEQLVEEVQRLVRGHNLEVVDATHLVPDGPNASWLEWPCSNCQLETRSEAEPEKVFIVLRTKTNTPAFLGGTLYGYACSHGSLEQAVWHARTSDVPCPAGVVMHSGGQHFPLPVTVSQSGPELVAKVVAAVVLNRPDMFRCSICDQNFATMSPDGADRVISMSRFISAPCDHAFHAHCLSEHFREGNNDCPVCGEVLPACWNKSACLQPKPLTGTADEQEAQLNELAEQVRLSMLNDGLISEEDMEAFV